LINELHHSQSEEPELSRPKLHHEDLTLLRQLAQERIRNLSSVVLKEYLSELPTITPEQLQKIKLRLLNKIEIPVLPFYMPIAKDILAGIANVFLGAIVDNALAEISVFDFLRDVISDKIAQDGAAFVTKQFRKSLEEDELWG